MMDTKVEEEALSNFIQRFGVDAARGLTRDEAQARRQLHGANRVSPPLQCPSWLCCLLPCLAQTPAMQNYNEALPREARVRRRLSNATTRTLRMDATSLVVGDVVEVHAGDIIAADMRIIEASNDCIVDQSKLLEASETSDEGDDLTLESGSVRGSNMWRKKVSTEPPSSRPSGNYPDKALCLPHLIYMTTKVVEGSLVAVVVATGDNTVWGQLLLSQQWTGASAIQQASNPTSDVSPTELSPETESQSLMDHQPRKI